MTNPPVAPRSVAEALGINQPRLLYDVVRTDNATHVLFYKRNYENIRGSLTLEGVGEPTLIEAAEFAIAAGQHTYQGCAEAACAGIPAEGRRTQKQHVCDGYE